MCETLNCERPWTLDLQKNSKSWEWIIVKIKHRHIQISVNEIEVIILMNYTKYDTYSPPTPIGVGLAANGKYQDWLQPVTLTG